MNKKALMIIIILIIVGISGWVINSKSGGNLISPNLGSTKTTSFSTPTPAPPVAPKTFQFDASTDLEAELEKVNPEVLDSDFE